MKFPFDTSEQLIFEFEELLKDNGLTIQSNSDLERVSIAVLETNAKHKKEIAHDNNTDIREVFADVAGIVDFVNKIVKNKSHPNFDQLLPHLEILNKAGSTVLTTKSRVTDDGNNKLMELYIALLCMRFGTDIELDDPNNSKGDNPDVIFNHRGKKWAIACKAMHSSNEKTLYDTIVKGTDQINKSEADKGIVAVNFKNIIDRDQIWPILNKSEVANGQEPIFGCHSTSDIPIRLLQSYGCDYQKKLMESIGFESLSRLSNSGKCPVGFLIFLQAMTSVQFNGNCPPTILKTFNLVQFNNIDDDYKYLGQDLNEAMHDQI